MIIRLCRIKSEVITARYRDTREAILIEERRGDVLGFEKDIT